MRTTMSELDTYRIRWRGARKDLKGDPKRSIPGEGGGDEAGTTAGENASN